MSQDINQKIKLQEVYEYGGPKFTNCYYKEKLGRFKLVLLCLRRAIFYTGEILKCCATDIFYICKPSHPQEPLLKKIILSVTFLVSLAGVLSVPGLMAGLYLGLTLLTKCAFGTLAIVAAFTLIIFAYKFVKSCIKYMKENSKAVKQVVLYPCKCNSDGKVYFHKCPCSRQTKRSLKDIDLDYIPRSLVTSSWSCRD